MQNYGSYENMFKTMIQHGFSEEKTVRGCIYKLDPKLGEGKIELWGSGNIAFVELDITYKDTNISVNYSDNVGVQITFIDNNDMEYYSNEKVKEKTPYGTFFYINNTSVPWFKKYPAGERIKALTLLIGEEFLKSNGINLSHEDWNNMARTINLRNISIAQIATILRQIKNCDIADDLFPLYFKTKSIEAFLLLLNFSMSHTKNLNRLSIKSQAAVKQAVGILSQNYINPPVITELAKIVGVDKKTLQSAFLEIVGLSIHKYVRSLKMQYALLLLKNDTMSVERVSKEVGYNSKIHFYKAFKDVFFMKPSEMRQLLK